MELYAEAPQHDGDEDNTAGCHKVTLVPRFRDAICPWFSQGYSVVRDSPLIVNFLLRSQRWHFKGAAGITTLPHVGLPLPRPFDGRVFLLVMHMSFTGPYSFAEILILCTMIKIQYKLIKYSDVECLHQRPHIHVVEVRCLRTGCTVKSMMRVIP